MTCNDAQAYLAAYLDNELETADSIRVEQHITSCQHCRWQRDEILALRSVIAESDLFERPAPELAHRVRDAVRTAAQVEAPRQRHFRFVPVSWAAAAILVLTVGAGLYFASHRRDSEQNLIASEVVDEHIRSLQPGHLLDVPSSDRHTVKPWFQGRLDFAPSVPDLSGRGFPLQGGRLTYINQRPVAALVYRRRQHEINVFLWPNRGSVTNQIVEQQSQGYHVLHWNGSPMTCWVVSDLDPSELREFARALGGR